VEVFFDTRNTICGAKTNHYLLEKSRVTFQAAGERNYHIFFQLSAGCDEALASKLKLKEPSEYAYLSASGCLEIDGVNDAEEFVEVRKAMKDLFFKESEQVYWVCNR
jgi:myosin heavy subunit